MGAKGFIYVLANSSMPGLVKVGKTYRSPESRAQELAGATGVPTPFMVIYDQFCNDCDTAEQEIHAILSARGLRETNNREFFRASAKDVISVIIDYANSTAAKQEVSFDDSSCSDECGENARPWSEVWELAENARYGSNGAIQDYAEAFNLYRQAARLGYNLAYREMGDMYLNGEGMRENASMALDCYKKGVKNGDYLAYFRMADTYLRLEQYDNHEKAMTLLFSSWADRNSRTIVDSEEKEAFLSTLHSYITVCLIYEVEIPYSIKDKMRAHRYDILGYMERGLRSRLDRGKYKAAKRVESEIKWFKSSFSV